MKKTLLLFLLLPFLTFAQSLSGDYIISTANTDANFRTLSSAIARLDQVGVNGPVNFLLDQDQTATSQYVIKEISGSSKTNILTIKPNVGRNDIKITINKPNDYTGIATVFLFNGASNVVIDGSNSSLNNKNLTLINTDNLAYIQRAIIWIASNGIKGSTNITVKNSNLKFTNRNSGVNLLSGIYSGNNTIGGNNTITIQANSASNSDITILSNEMINVKEGIYINGNSNATLSPNTWKIQGNKIGSSTTEEKPIRGMYVSNALNYEISGNTISGIRNTENQSNDCAAILLLGTSSGTISSNKINNIENIWYNNSYLTAGILVKSSRANTIANNIISNVYTSAETSENGNFHQRGHNVFIESGSATNVYYNTIISSGGKSTRASCLYITGGSGINVRNNIFINTQSGIQYGIFKTGGTLGTVSHNNYYVTNSSGGFSNRIGGGQNGVEYIGTGPTGSTAWTSATSESTYTIINPSFTSDYHLQDVANNKNLQGIAISEVTTDIDGEARIKPYIGADELAPCAPTEDPTVFGDNIWKGYVYKWTQTNAVPALAFNETPNPAVATYVGTVTENKNFDRDVNNGAITGLTSNFPCEAAPSDYFLVRYKMRTKVTEAGLYNFMIAGDDGIRLYVNGNLILQRWSGGSYAVNSVLYELEANKDYEFVLEYFEIAGAARASFSFGLIKGDPTVFGDKVWNVYGYNKNDISLTNAVYAGYYVDPNPNANSTAFWPTTKSPYAASNWQGAPMPNDYFTVVSKRTGFACGQYQIQVANYDDDLQIYVDGNKIFDKSGNTDTAVILDNDGKLFALNSKTKIEIRLKENGGGAKSSVLFINVPTTNTGNANGSSLVINADTTLQSDLTVCSCTINDKKTLTVPKNITLTVDEDITVLGDGKLLILDGGSFLQTSTDNNMFKGSKESFEAQRTVNITRFDITYWSSPVSDFSMHDLSPETLYDKFASWDNTNGKWATIINGLINMDPGTGYSIRGPQSHDINQPSDFTAKFIGTPNNGDIEVKLVSGKFNFIGNPYPSSIDAEEFISNNGEVGALYFWSHNTPPKIVEGTNTYRYSSSDYAVFSMMGQTRPSPKGQAPDGHIGTGQGFFIQPNVNSIFFKNGQRLKANNTTFFKTTSKNSTIEKNRIWLNLTNNDDAFKQMLVGYATGATNSWDYNYDATTMGSNSYIDFYSINESKRLTIQGRALPFDNTDTVPLGYKSTFAGDLTISIDHVDGLFNNQEIYLEDKLKGVIIDLRKENYTFKTAIGTSSTRFVLRFTNKTLGTDDFENIADGLLVAVKSKVINITSGIENIKEVQIYTIGGQLLYSKSKIDAKELEIANLHSSNQVLLAKVILENNHEVTKKIIFN
ncbi:PA14 domain-containing protein [Flavobacterium anhuiense]|uniref:PA14 domain-containing protein n=1 Tax=Flavobacterium anhuiense TaxID=459526 RepID=UPI003D96F4BD